MTETSDQASLLSSDQTAGDPDDRFGQVDSVCDHEQEAKAAPTDQEAAASGESAAEDLDRSGFQNAQLTGTLAHELRTPLSSIGTAAFIIKRKAASVDLDITEPYRRLENSLRRCNDVITTLLDKSWTNQLQPVELPIDEWLAKQVRSFASRAPRSIDIQCDLTVGDQAVHFDPVRLESALSNILSNAVEALVGDGINAPEVQIADPTISIVSKLTARGVEITLSNNGPCIPDGKIENIMQPWVTTKAFGSGLGLPLVKCIMEQHGGGLDIENLQPQGVVFTAWINDKATA